MADYFEAPSREPLGGIAGGISMRQMQQAREVAPPRQKPTMVSALEAIAESEKRLADRLDALITRLSPILQIRPKDAINGKSSSESCGAQIPDALFNHAGNLDAHTRQIQEILEALAI